MHLVNKVSLATLLVLAFALPAAASVVEEHVPNGNTQLVWVPGFNTNRMLIGGMLDGSDPAYANPSGDHTVGVLTTAVSDSGGLALSCTDPQGTSDYTWEGWMFTGDSNSRRGLIVRGDFTSNFNSTYQFVLYSGNAQLSFRKLLNQTPQTLQSWIGPAIPGGIPAANTWHHMKITAIGNTFRLWWDTTELTAAGPIVDNNSPLLTGWVGVYNFRFDISNLTTYFDDLVLTDERVTPTRNSTWGSLKALYR